MKQSLLKIMQVMIDALNFLIRKVFFTLSFFAFFAIAIVYANDFLSYSAEKYKILFGAIALTGTLAGLSLRTSSSCCPEENEKKKILYNCGERFFHATLLFIVAAVVQYNFQTMNSLKINEDIEKIIKYLFLFASYFLFYYGLLYCIIAIKGLHKILFKGWDAPLD